MPERSSMLPPGGDPSPAAAAQLFRAIENLEHLFNATLHRVEEVTDQRIKAIDLQLATMEKQRVEQKHDATVAIDAALKAQKESVHAAFEAAEKALDQKSDMLNKEFREHLEHAREQTRASFDSSEKAIAKAEAANKERFESMNRFREQLADQAASFMPRKEAEQGMARNTEKIEAVAAISGAHVTRVETEAKYGQLSEKIAAVESGLATKTDRAEGLAWFNQVNDKMTLITTRIDKSEGKGAGLHAGWIYILGAVAALGTLASLYLAFTGK